MEILKIEIEEQLLINYYVIKHLILLKIQSMADSNVYLLQWSIKFLIKKTCGTVKNEVIYNKKLAKKLRKPIFRKFEKRKAHSTFADNIWGADLAYMQLINKLNKESKFLLCGIDIYSKYAWVIPLKDKNEITIINGFQRMLNESKRKPNHFRRIMI